MIPKTIHYCWFGEKPIPDEYRRYIDSWRKHMPDYEIVEWNESNYDVNCIPFSAEAYNLKQYAYVSDYARLRILYEHGGVYLDTDVEMIRPIGDILERGGFMAVEKHATLGNADEPEVALGLGFAVPPHHPVVREIMNYYETHHFQYPDGEVKQITIVKITMDALKGRGMGKLITGELTTLEGITIYPWDYFCPKAYLSNKLEMTPNTRTIHHYSATWLTVKQKIAMRVACCVKMMRQLLGGGRKNTN